MKIHIMLTGRSYHTTEHLPDMWEVPPAASLDDVLQLVNARLPAGQVLSRSCLVIFDNRHIGTLGSHEQVELRDGSELVLIAPVAGG